MTIPHLQFRDLPNGYKGEVKLIDGHLVPWPPQIKTAPQPIANLILSLRTRLYAINPDLLPF